MGRGFGIQGFGLKVADLRIREAAVGDEGPRARGVE